MVEEVTTEGGCGVRELLKTSSSAIFDDQSKGSDTKTKKWK